MLPTTPQFTSAAQPDDHSKQFTLYWDSVPGAFYRLYRDGVLWLDNIGASAQGDDTIDYNRQYIYRVSAVIGELESALSVPVVLTATALGIPYATAADLAAYWRPLTGDEPARAEALITMASDRLRLMLEGQTPDLDAKANASATYRNALKWVVLDAVKRAMMSPTDQPPLESYGQTAGVYSENFKYVNPTGDLYFKKSELASLGLGGKQKLSGFITAPERLYE